ncbi:MAG: SGNH/GDSL hydrolase family protein [Saccharospirillum sp.]
MSPGRWLFLGDSVTDCERNRALKQPNRPDGLGNGWVNRVATELLAKDARQQIWNRGYAGCRVGELLDQPGWLPVRNTHYSGITLMIGINDIWHPFNQGVAHDLDGASEAFDTLLQTLRPLCDTLYVLEPLAIAGPAVTEAWWPLLLSLQQRQQALTQAAGGTWLALQADFEAASQTAPALWAYDGVHPGVLGHQWLAQRWLRIGA